MIPVSSALVDLPLPSATGRDVEFEQRRSDAHEVFCRLPPFLRVRQLSLLEARISDPKLSETAKAWQRGSGSMLFHGQTGTGKTTAAAALFLRLLCAGVREGGDAWRFARSMRWFRADTLAKARREHPLGHGDAPEVSESGRAGLLVLDDCGWDRDVQATSEVLEERYGRKLPTVVTTGMNLEQLKSHYGDAVVRRLIESGGLGCVILECRGT